MKNLDLILENIQKNNFLIIGRAGIDIYPDPPGTKTENAKKFVTHLGGSSANIAVALTKLGGKCHLLTCVSNDALGRLAVNSVTDNDFPVLTGVMLLFTVVYVVVNFITDILYVVIDPRIRIT